MKFGFLRTFGVIVALVLSGCEDPPDLQPLTPPGAFVPKASPDAEPAQARGEAAPTSNKTSTEPPALTTTNVAPATKKGEFKTTPGGVEYQTLKEGTGAELKPGQSAEIEYEGKLQNGTVFDTSRGKTPPHPFPVVISTGQVIKGWDEAIPGMKVGEVRKLTIPPAMAYAEKGFPPKIPPGSTLIFEVELVSIK